MTPAPTFPPAEDSTAYTAAGLPLPAPDTLRGDLHFTKRFWAKVQKGHWRTCWAWTASKDEKGYGRIRIGSTMYAAHRVSYMLATGRWPSASRMILHSCDTPGCVNPRHLREGTVQENHDDMTARGRRYSPSSKRAKQVKRRASRTGLNTWRGAPAEGMLRGGSALSEWAVREIRRKVAESGGVQAARRDGSTLLLAVEFGVSEAAVYQAAAGKTFAWVIGNGGRPQ